MSYRNWALGGLALSVVIAAAGLTGTSASAQTTSTPCPTTPVRITLNGQPAEVCNGRVQQPSQVRSDFNEPAPPPSGRPTVQRAVITVDSTDGSWRTPQQGEYSMRQVTFDEYARSPNNGGQAGWTALLAENFDGCREVGWQAGEALAITRRAQEIGGSVLQQRALLEGIASDIGRTSWGRRFLEGLGIVVACLRFQLDYCVLAGAQVLAGELNYSSNDRHRRFDLRQRADDIDMRELDLRTRVLDGRMRLSWTSAMLRRGGCTDNQPTAVEAGLSTVEPFRATRVNYTQDNRNRGNRRGNAAPAATAPQPQQQPAWMTWSPGQP